jgi:hypothetical protein
LGYLIAKGSVCYEASDSDWNQNLGYAFAAGYWAGLHLGFADDSGALLAGFSEAKGSHIYLEEIGSHSEEEFG